MSRSSAALPIDNRKHSEIHRRHSHRRIVKSQLGKSRTRIDIQFPSINSIAIGQMPNS
jgi:hypothetical protein